MVRRRDITVLAIGLALGSVVVPSVSLPAAAQVVAHPSKAALDAKVAGLKAALLEKRYGALVTDIPPKLLDLLSAKVGMPREQFLVRIEQQVTQVMAGSSIDRFEVETGDIKTLANGATYALLPSVTHVTVSGRKARSNGHIVALVDTGRWYLARISETQWPIFVEAYPAYAALDIPKEKLEFVQ